MQNAQDNKILKPTAGSPVLQGTAPMELKCNECSRFVHSGKLDYIMFV